MVISQSPLAGEEVKQEGKYVLVSKARPATIPDVEGMTLKEASIGFKMRMSPWATSRMYYEQIEKDRVISRTRSRSSEHAGRLVVS